MVGEDSSPPDVTCCALGVRMSFQRSTGETEHWEQLGSLCTAAADLVLGPCASGDDATQIWAAGGGGSASAANAGAERSRSQVPVGRVACPEQGHKQHYRSLAQRQQE